MKKALLASVHLLLCSILFAQTANVTWGEEYKLKKGSTNLEVIHSDNSGVYVKESHYALASYFVVAATFRESATLTKLDKDLNELYTNNFNKELKGKDYEDFFFLKDKLFLLATDYSGKTKTLTLYAAEINKATGELAGDFAEVTNWQKDDKKEKIDFKASYNFDSTKMVLVSTVKGREKNVYEVRQYDEKMKATDKPIVFSNEFDPKTFQVEDVLFTNNSNVVLIGREYEFEEGKKKKAKFLDFKNYNIRIYDNQGKQVKEINTTINGKWLVSTKVKQIPDKDLVLAAFYSNEKRGKEINGLLLQRINPQTGDVISTSQKDINTSMITTIEDDTADNGDKDDEDSKKEKKERERLEKIQNDEDGFSKYMRFRNFIYTPDKGIVILAEKYNSYTYTTYSYSSGAVGFGGRSTSTTYQVYECGDIMMSKIDAAGNINWLNVLPKQQREVIEVGSGSSPSSGISFNFGFSYFYSGFNWPFYAGFGTMLGDNNTVNIIFNDSKKNENVLQLGQKVKKISLYGTSQCFDISLNAITGKYTRSILFSNKETPTVMPRLGSVLGKDLYLIGKQDKLFGKTHIAIAKVTIK